LGTQLDLSQTRIIDPILSDRALGFGSQEQKWMKLAPPVIVGNRAGQITKFGQERFDLVDSYRAPGANTERIDIGYAAQPFKLVQDRLKTSVPIEHQEEAQIPGIDLRAEAVDTVRELQERKLEDETARLLTISANYPAGHAPVIAAGDKWDTLTADPVRQVLNARTIIRRKIARTPNTLFFCGEDAWIAWRENEKIKARIQYSERAIITEDITGEMVRLDVVVGMDVKKTATGMVDIWAQNGKNVILAWVPTNPMGINATGGNLQIGKRSNRNPAFAYTYVLKGCPYVEQGEYVKDTASWEDYVTYERQPFITMPEAGYLFRDVVA
jgi:hypothetical protein